MKRTLVAALASILAVVCTAQNPSSIRRDFFGLQLGQKLNMEILAESLDIEEDQISVNSRGTYKTYSPDTKLEFAQEKWHAVFHVHDGRLAVVELMKQTTSLTSMLPLYNNLEKMLDSKYARIGRRYPGTVRKDKMSESRQRDFKDERTGISLNYDTGLVFNSLSLSYGDIRMVKAINSAVIDDL